MDGRDQLEAWKEEIRQNSYLNDADFRHTVSYYLPKEDQALSAFAKRVVEEVEPLVAENSRAENLPRVENYDPIGNRVEKIIHHPSYVKAGNIIYSSGMLEKMAKKGGLLEGLLYFFLSSQAGEAGHNCPIACSYGIIRVLQKYPEVPHREEYLRKLVQPSFEGSFTGAQFVTEVQGGSDAGKNRAVATLEKGQWKVSGEKWFCSNANADLILMTARYDPNIEDTKGLGLFLVPRVLEDGSLNHFAIRRLKDKLGTRTLATAEIDFNEAHAYPIGTPEQGFKILMENVLHFSRLFNSVTVLAMARRAFQIALSYAKHREAFGQPIFNYPLVQENLAYVKAENNALVASIFAVLKLQDANESEEQKLLLRLLANLSKTLTSKASVQHIHRCLDVLAGNGTIESFSPIPLLLRDSIICENWEGTHNVLKMQILKDILRYNIDAIFLKYLEPLIQKAEQLHPLGATLRTMYQELTLKFKELREAPQDLQTLLISGVTDAMGMLFAAVHLLFEAVDQESKGSSSKMHCLTFNLSTVNPTEHLILVRNCLKA
ncbi:MAG: acyl-CoA dehydrogenase family protein [Parachlamydiaceae bacterium]